MATRAARPTAKTAAAPVKKPAAKATPKAAAKAVPTAAPKAAPRKTVKPAAPPVAAPAAPEKKREKLVRDGFTMPKGEYAAIGTLKKRAEGLARPAKKSELLRAGIALLAALLKALAAVPAIKTGRPAKG